MKKITELLKEKKWRWTVGGVSCLTLAAIIYALTLGLGVRAESMNLGGVTISTDHTGVYLISTEAELKALGMAAETDTTGKTFRLANDISVSAVTVPASGVFAGVFDGSGHVIAYEDIAIESVEATATSESGIHGLLFGTVSGTVQNVVIDIEDGDASYSRKTKNAAMEDGAPVYVYEEEKNPILAADTTVSGLDKDPAKAGEIHAALQTGANGITGPENGVFTQVLEEQGTKTVKYVADAAGTDYFGLICGDNKGTIEKVYVTGNSVSIGRTELTSLDHSQMVEEGYRTETYKYKQEIVSDTETKESKELNLTGTAYPATKNYVKTFADEELKLTVTAPREVAAGSQIVYTVKVENNGTEDYPSVSLSANQDGKWTVATEETEKAAGNALDIGPIAASGSKEVSFAYDTAETSGTASVAFTVSGKNAKDDEAETKSADLTSSGIVTAMIDISDEQKAANGVGIDLRVAYPKAIVKGNEIVYTLYVSNSSQSDYQNLKLTSNVAGAWTSMASTASGESITLSLPAQTETRVTFRHTPDGNTSVVFTASANGFFGVDSGLTGSPEASVSCAAIKQIDSALKTSVHSVARLKAAVSAPASVKAGSTQLKYEITVTNESDSAYSDVTLQASKEGNWGTSESAAQTMSLGGIAAKGSRTVTFTLSASEDPNLDITVSGKKADGTVVAKLPGISTYFFDASENTVTEEFTNGLHAALHVKARGILGSEAWNYTLTLENTNPVPTGAVISKDIAVALPDGWTVDPDKTTATNFDTDSLITAGKKVVLTKNIAASTIAEQETSVTNTQSVKVDAALTTCAYQYTNITDSNTCYSAFISAGEAITSGDPITSGNVLYAGNVSGRSVGVVKEIKQETQFVGKVNTEELILGGVSGQAENVASNWSDLYLPGASVYYGKGQGTPAASTTSSTPTKLSDNWTAISKYEKAAGGTLSPATSYDLEWLVKDGVFDYASPVSGSLTASVTNGLSDARQLKYAIAYNARKSLDDASEELIYLSESDGEVILGVSGYYRVLNAYATDGYYHYVTQTIELEDAPYRYPYNVNAPFTISDQKIIRSNENPLLDVVELKLTGTNTETAVSGTLYFDVNKKAAIPTTGSDEVEITNGIAHLPFEVETVQYSVAPVVDRYVYPTLITREFRESDKPALPKPAVTCYNYYDFAGNKNTYTPFVSSTGSEERAYDAGSDMMIASAQDTTSAESYSYRYLFAAEHYDASNWNEQRYMGTDRSFMDDALEYTDSAVIPEEMAGQKNVYLYVEVSKKHYSSQIYCFGPFAVSAADKLSAKVNGQIENSNVILNGDRLEITGAPEHASIEIAISRDPEMKFSGSEYPVSGITMSQDTGAYVYARIKYSDSKYGPVQLFDYTFGDACADPRVTPNTGLSSGGEVAAATIGSAITISLSSRTPGAEIFYLVSAESQAAGMERVLNLPDDISEALDENGKVIGDGTVSSDGYKYFYIGSRWYRTTSVDLERYERGFSISHENEEAQLMYVSAITLADGYEPSTMLEYVYKVQPAQQVSNPEAAYETRYMPGGEDIEVESVSANANISFLSLTPEATLYYAIGSGTNIPMDEIPEEGVKVEGNYGDNFVVRVIAKKAGMLDSDVITFVYKISDQEQTNAPTATPGTTADVPTTVIPGNKILLSTTTKEAMIFYTIDGSSPQIVENEDGSYSVAEEDQEITKQYDPNTGIVMPADGSGYFSITAVAVKTGLAKSQEVHFTYSYPGTVLAPYANMDSGKVDLDTNVILKNLTEGAVIYYTVSYGNDIPADPTLSSSVFHQEYPFVISQKTTIKAMAVKDGIKSTIVTFTYDPMAQLDSPKPSIASGSVVSRGTVLQLKVSDGAIVYYTMDGSDPTDSTNASVMSGNTLALNGDVGGQITIKAYATAADKSRSEVVTFTYRFSQNFSGITASIESGTLVSNGRKVNLMTDVTDAEIYYTTDGSSPIGEGVKGSIVEIDGAPGSSFTVKAVAIANGEAGSITTFIYRIKEKPIAPTASPAGGVLTVATRVSLNAGDANIYYTTDGTEPTKSSTPYSEPILINRTTTLKAIAVSKDGEFSEVASYTYTAAAKAATVISSEEDGAVLEPGAVIRLSTATNGAVIYYSTDGTEPTIDNLDSMLIYYDEIEIHRSVTVRAVAYRDDLRLSNVATWNYLVDVIPAVEQKREEAQKLAEEGLQDTDISGLVRQNEKEKEAVTRTVREKEYQTGLAYTSDALPARIHVETEQKGIDAYTEEKVKGIFGADSTILEAYKMKVKNGNTSVQPTEDVEVMFRIPKGYEDATLSVAMVGNDHNLTTLETRRDADVLYAKTAKIGSYVIIGPKRDQEEETAIPYLRILEVAAGITMFVGIVFYVKEKIKKIVQKRKRLPKRVRKIKK